MNENRQRTYGEVLQEGFNRLKSTDLVHAKSRLEWVIEQNPDIDKERIIIPPEFQDMLCFLSRSIYINKLKSSAYFFLSSAALLSFSYFAMKYSLNSPESFLPTILFSGSMVSGIPGLQCLYYGCNFLYNGARSYNEFRKDKFAKPLTDKERRLARYVLMLEKKTD